MQTVGKILEHLDAPDAVSTVTVHETAREKIGAVSTRAIARLLSKKLQMNEFIAAHYYNFDLYMIRWSSRHIVCLLDVSSLVD